MDEESKGRLVIIGGAEDKQGEKRILKKVVEMVKEGESKIVILTTATEKPQELGNTYVKVFSGLGLKDIEVLNINSRNEANQEEYCRKIKAASGLFFTGGDQLRITSILGGTLTHMALNEAFFSGLAIIGTSAGASVMSSTMIVDGDSNDPARKCTLKMAPGFGFMSNTIIDQHFAQRGRIGRILCGVAENPDMLAVGIDEDTAIIANPDRTFDVIGTNSVTVIDGKSINYSNVSELSPDEILAISGITLHVMPDGYSFDMNKREVFRRKLQ